MNKIPNDSLLNSNNTNFDYVDVYSSIVVDKNENVTLMKVIGLFFHSGPPWLRYLMYIRNNIVSVIGLKTSSNSHIIKDSNFDVGDKIGLFNIYQKTNNEIVMGENDKHLDFRVSLLMEAETQIEQQKRIVITTAVKFNNWFGKFYFTVVKPFHKVIVKAMLNNIIKKIEHS